MKSYDLTIIIPFYKKYFEFEYCLEYNYKNFKKAKEIILIIDHDVKIQKLSFIKNYNLNFIIYKNSDDHPWRNPAVVLNFGLKKSTCEFVMIFSPESILLSDIDLLIQGVDSKNFNCGEVVFTTKQLFEESDYQKLNTYFNKYVIKNNLLGPLKYGSICASKKNFKDCGLYDEKLLVWGNDDDGIRERLKSIGVIQNQIKFKIVHIEFSSNIKYFKKSKNKTNKNIFKEIVDSMTIDEKTKFFSQNPSILKQLISNLPNLKNILNYQ